MVLLSKIKLSWLVIIVLSVLLFLQIECHHCPKSEPCPGPDTIQTIKIIKGDSIPHELPPVIAPDPDSIKPQPVPVGIDSGAIASAYFSKVYGYVKMVDDSSMYVGFRYLVEENKLRWVIPKVANRKITAYYFNTTYVYQNQPKTKLFLGLGLSVFDTIPGLKQNRLAPSIHASFALLTKKDHLYTISADPFREFYTATAYMKLKWPIKKKSK